MWTLSDTGISSKSKMAALTRSTYVSHIHIIHTSTDCTVQFVGLDEGRAITTSLHCCIEAELVRSLLPIMGGHLWFTTYLDVEVFTIILQSCWTPLIFYIKLPSFCVVSLLPILGGHLRFATHADIAQFTSVTLCSSIPKMPVCLGIPVGTLYRSWDISLSYLLPVYGRHLDSFSDTVVNCTSSKSYLDDLPFRKNRIQNSYPFRR